MPIPNSDFDPKNTLVILLGAEEWAGCKAIAGDDFPLGEENPFTRSVEGIKEYFIDELKIEPANLKSWFNSKEDSNTIINEIKDFIQDTKATDLFFYYVGHGIKSGNHSYLLLRSSEQNLNHTYFDVYNLFNLLEVKAKQLRCYIILDACFSGAAAKQLSSTNIGLFHSSFDNQIARILADKSMTLFTKALLDVLRGDCDQDYPSHLELLSFSDLKLLVNHTMKKIHGDERVATAGFFCNSGVVDNLKIFRNPKYKEGEDEGVIIKPPTRNIAWHIVTSGKGGVGKTLLSLFLVTYYHEDLNKYPLIIDFNGVNTDLKRLINDDNLIDTNVPVEEIQIDDNKLTICKIVKGNIPHLLGWMNDPYKTYNPQYFLRFLRVLREHLPKIQKRFEDDMYIDIDTIIIDTNYHFCNLFSRNSEDYSYFPFWETDRFFIWFIWVYRQIQNAQQLIIGKTDTLINQFNTDVNYMKDTAIKLEQVSINYPTPFIHVINPMSLTESSIIREFVKMLSGQRWEVVPALQNLAKLDSVPDSKKFNLMLKLMTDAQIQANAQNFSEMLEQLSSSLKTRPINLFPLDTHEQGLVDAWNKRKKLEVDELQVYKTFSKLFLDLLKSPYS